MNVFLLCIYFVLIPSVFALYLPKKQLQIDKHEGDNAKMLGNFRSEFPFLSEAERKSVRPYQKRSAGFPRKWMKKIKDQHYIVPLRISPSNEENIAFQKSPMNTNTDTQTNMKFLKTLKRSKRSFDPISQNSGFEGFAHDDRIMMNLRRLRRLQRLQQLQRQERQKQNMAPLAIEIVMPVLHRRANNPAVIEDIVFEV